MGTRYGRCIVVIGILIAGFCGTAHLADGVADATLKSSYVNHHPIQLNGNKAFIHYKGVTRGNGTRSDPFVIENWYIDNPDKNSIEIRNSSVHFVIRNTWTSAGCGNHGLLIDNVTNGTIERCVFDESFVGIELKNSRNMTVINNTISRNEIGIDVAGIVDCRISRNGLYYNDFQFNSAQNRTTINNCTFDQNYWSDYDGADTDLDGFGDTQLPHNNMDFNPLMNATGPFRPAPPIFDDKRTIMDAIVEHYWISQLFVIGGAFTAMIYLTNRNITEPADMVSEPVEEIIEYAGMKLRTSHGFRIDRMPPLRLEYS